MKSMNVTCVGLFIFAVATSICPASIDVLVENDEIMATVGIPDEVLSGDSIGVDIFDGNFYFVSSFTIDYDGVSDTFVVYYQDGMYLYDDTSDNLMPFYGRHLSSAAGIGKVIIKAIKKIFTKRKPKPKPKPKTNIAPGRLPGIGTKAVVPQGITRSTEGSWPAVMKDGKVYVERFHNLATRAANGGKLGPIDADGFVKLDKFGNVIEVNWGWVR